MSDKRYFVAAGNTKKEIQIENNSDVNRTKIIDK